MQELDNIRIHFDQDGLFILNIALAIVIFGVALGITLEDFKNLRKEPKSVFVGVISQFLFLPLLTYLLVLLINPKPSIALGMFLLAACPGGNISNFMSHLAKANVALSVSLSAIATVLAIFMTPFNFQFYANLYQPTAEILTSVDIVPSELVKTILLILGVPLVAGMWMRHKYEQQAIKVSNYLKPVSMIVFLAFVVIAFVNNLDVFNNHIQEVIVIGIAHNLIALSLGFCLAVIFGLSMINRKTIAIETGIQNSGLGLVLVFTFFEDLGGMALIVAFWGIWHIVSGLLLATFWSRK